MSIKFVGVGILRVKRTSNNNEFSLIQTMGDYGKDLPIFFPERLSKPPRDAFIQVSGKLTLNRNNFLMMVCEHWETVETGDECRYSAGKPDDNQDSGRETPPLHP